MAGDQCRPASTKGELEVFLAADDPQVELSASLIFRSVLASHLGPVNIFAGAAPSSALRLCAISQSFFGTQGELPLIFTGEPMRRAASISRRA